MKNIQSKKFFQSTFQAFWALWSIWSCSSNLSDPQFNVTFLVQLPSSVKLFKANVIDKLTFEELAETNRIWFRQHLEFDKEFWVIFSNARKSVSVQRFMVTDGIFAATILCERNALRLLQNSLKLFWKWFENAATHFM